MARNATNKLLHNAKRSKSDEFYTQYVDIQKLMLQPTYMSNGWNQRTH